MTLYVQEEIWTPPTPLHQDAMTPRYVGVCVCAGRHMCASATDSYQHVLSALSCTHERRTAGICKSADTRARVCVCGCHVCLCVCLCVCPCTQATSYQLAINMCVMCVCVTQVTSYQLAINMASEAVNGPAWDGDGSGNGHPAFDWRDWKDVAHIGMVTQYRTIFELQAP